MTTLIIELEIDSQSWEEKRINNTNYVIHFKFRCLFLHHAVVNLYFIQNHRHSLLCRTRNERSKRDESNCNLQRAWDICTYNNETTVKLACVPSSFFFFSFSREKSVREFVNRVKQNTTYEIRRVFVWLLHG